MSWISDAIFGAGEAAVLGPTDALLVNSAAKAEDTAQTEASGPKPAVQQTIAAPSKTELPSSQQAPMVTPPLPTSDVNTNETKVNEVNTKPLTEKEKKEKEVEKANNKAKFNAGAKMFSEGFSRGAAGAADAKNRADRISAGMPEEFNQGKLVDSPEQGNIANGSMYNAIYANQPQQVNTEIDPKNFGYNIHPLVSDKNLKYNIKPADEDVKQFLSKMDKAYNRLQGKK